MSVDLEEMRRKHKLWERWRCTWCSREREAEAGPCLECGTTTAIRLHRGDPSVLALCDEAESLRARLAAGPEVLREWPTEETLKDAASVDWMYLGKRHTIRGRFVRCVDHIRFDGGGTFSYRPYFKAGEFFVRVP